MNMPNIQSHKFYLTERMRGIKHEHDDYIVIPPPADSIYVTRQDLAEVFNDAILKGYLSK